MANEYKRFRDQPDDTFVEMVSIRAGATLHPLDMNGEPAVNEKAVRLPAGRMNKYWTVIAKVNADGFQAKLGKAEPAWLRWYVDPNQVDVLPHPNCAYCTRPATQVKGGYIICTTANCEKRASRAEAPNTVIVTAPITSYTPTSPREALQGRYEHALVTFAIAWQNDDLLPILESLKGIIGVVQERCSLELDKTAVDVARRERH